MVLTLLIMSGFLSEVKSQAFIAPTGEPFEGDLVHRKGFIGIGVESLPEKYLHLSDEILGIPPSIRFQNNFYMKGDSTIVEDSTKAPNYISYWDITSTPKELFFDYTGPFSDTESYIPEISFSTNGEISAKKFYGNGSSLTGLPWQKNGTNLYYNSGNVGIGITSPSAKLTVDGKILCTQIDVVQTIWSDFVFEDDYNLIPLSELEGFIKQNKHLPEIPSEEEVVNGTLNLGEMNALLLQKIEELTLYILEQDKRIKKIENELLNSKN